MSTLSSCASFRHSGKLGDVIYSLAVVRYFRRVRFFLNAPGPEFSLEAAQGLLPLLRAQPYVEDVGIWSGEHFDFDLDRFRTQLPVTGNLVDRHAAALGFASPDPTEPWLWVEHPVRQPGRPVVFCRSASYRGVPGFWERCYEAFGSKASFIGTDPEHTDFCRSFGRIVRVEVEDILELARLIAGASLVVANQSCPYAIAEGLKRPVIQETCPTLPNCMFSRLNAAFVLMAEHLELALEAIEEAGIVPTEVSSVQPFI